MCDVFEGLWGWGETETVERVNKSDGVKRLG